MNLDAAFRDGADAQSDGVAFEENPFRGVPLHLMCQSTEDLIRRSLRNAWNLGWCMQERATLRNMSIENRHCWAAAVSGSGRVRADAAQLRAAAALLVAAHHTG
jgi:hypothetical protein